MKNILLVVMILAMFPLSTMAYDFGAWSGDSAPKAPYNYGTSVKTGAFSATYKKPKISGEELDPGKYLNPNYRGTGSNFLESEEKEN